MHKISKLIKSALYNSSAGEGAQALKMAGALMQREGVNPASFLQEKGIDIHQPELEMLRSRVRELEQQLAEAARAPASAAELRQAKELAIKWHHRAMALEQESREIAQAAVESHSHATRLNDETQKLRKRLQFVFFLGVGATLITGAISHNNGKTTGYSRGYSYGYKIASDEIENRRNQTIPALNNVSSPSDSASQPANKAVCYGLTPINDAYVKYVYTGADIQFFARSPKTENKWFDITKGVKQKNNFIMPNNYTRERFVEQIKKELGANNVKCKLGVLR